MSNSNNNLRYLKEKGIFPANKPLDPKTEHSVDPVVYDSLFFLDFNKNGNWIVGTSDVAGTFWEGTLLFCKDKTSMENFDYSGFFISETTSDGKFVRNDIIALAQDTASLHILALNNDYKLRSLTTFKVIDVIPQIGVWDNSNKILCCAEKSISIWDFNSVQSNLHRKPCEKFDNYHLDRITSVDTLRRDTNQFLSGGRDRICCIWDLRRPKAPSVAYANEFSSITSVSWNQFDDNYIIVGTQAGDVYLLDKREPEEFISVVHCFDSTVNKISFNNSHEFAVCGDVNEVVIVDSDKSTLQINYRNTEHTGPVKDLKWYEGELYSCGFGKCLIKHRRRPVN